MALANRKLIINLSNRSRILSGSQIIRGCICEGYLPDPIELHIPRLLWPVCRQWSASGARTSPGDQIYLFWIGKKAPAAT